jgi:hypothetical protein
MMIKTTYMKQLFILSFLLVAMSGRAQVRLDEVVKPGTKLIYAVKSDRGNYDFIVTVKDIKGTSFTWEMTSPADMKGEIAHTAKALQNAYKMYNYFQSESKTLDDQSLSVWLSQKMFNELVKGTNAVKVCMRDPLAEPVLMKRFMDGELNIKVDGNGTMIYDKFVKPARKVKDKWIIDPTLDEYFTYYPSATLPIIIRMGADFVITLKEVRTNG